MISFIALFYLIATLFILGTCIWAIYTVTKLQHEQMIALSIIKILGDRLKVSKEIHFLVEKQKEEEKKVSEVNP